jgi:hypothetical protein
MSWRRAALDERLEILKEQLREQLSRDDGSLLDWLEHQIKELMTVAACSAHDDYVGIETSRVRAAITFPLDGAATSTGAPSIALTDPATG